MSEPTIIYENKNYQVVLMDKVLGEDGRYGPPGYAILNKETGVVEHTTMVLPQAIFQADAFMGALGQLNSANDAEVDGASADVIDIGDLIDIDPNKAN